MPRASPRYGTRRQFFLTQSHSGGVNVNRNPYKGVKRKGHAKGHAEVEVKVSVPNGT